MKTKIFSIALMISIFIGSASFAQEHADKNNQQKRNMRYGNQQRRDNGHSNFFTAEQKESMKQIRFETSKSLKPFKDQLRELGAKQQTLMTADAPDMAAIDKNIKKMGELKTEMALVMAKSKLKVRALLTDEQKLMMESHRGKLKRGKRGPKSQKSMRG